MEFGWINLFGAAIVIILLIPNIFYAIKNKDIENRCRNKIMNAIEQIGRYGCIILMWLPLFVWKFEFKSFEIFLAYLVSEGLLLFAYVFIWILYFKKRSYWKAMALAIIPTFIFLISGLALHHWLLVVCAAMFGVGHIYVTYINSR
ncbi:hypothetical protein CDQ84_18995 [Clostridium thermosuccinogenes]|uniref:Uncharacterized protein n=2 Tax=Clostridium thermosuccinogenes TaxID=84032 RepID=A0A2K2EZI4_9CLOT|nr:hypothetical protein [Pseudoclostridium thermosuccinogenes]AUS97212.1 hypothetical protein CDO33_12640 [Pseudoclostridium thermosuccinogenes]PNT91761.1 hypothetical protein CDQ85_18930 [Pseudoclostridium thermosuccinogenes]PNT91932.1 hypothetical protein CDQ84_18995 [Pseudoclostridium thermosuccinogenes]PNT94327.1 hypothetical protein CDQ83_00620 [Pseudoclostridium thermosuccinogenes]